MSKADKTQLIQTAVCSIVYGQFGGEYQELFRCPRELDDVDLRGYVNDNRCVLGFENDDTKNGGIDGRKCIGYFRLYFTNGWYGRWFVNKGCHVSEKDICGVTNIINELDRNFPRGCGWAMREHMASTYEGANERYFIKPLMSDCYRIMVDTTYGNADYPVRIYVYQKEDAK